MKRLLHVLSWIMLIGGMSGFAITFPLWMTGRLSERTMLGITLALSWAALWYEAFNAIQISRTKD